MSGEEIPDWAVIDEGVNESAPNGDTVKPEVINGKYIVIFSHDDKLTGEGTNFTKFTYDFKFSDNLNGENYVGHFWTNGPLKLIKKAVKVRGLPFLAQFSRDTSEQMNRWTLKHWPIPPKQRKRL